MRKYLLGLLVVFMTLTMGLSAEDKPRAVIIFDASGSMWGQINGIAKIEIAKDALKNVVQDWNPDVELGLTVYGHRSKGDCDDIETVIPVGKIDKNRVISTVMDIQPKGKTPISRSLRKVAEEIKYTEEKATIILISDGKETCDPDPCGTAKELEKEGIDFVTHVIGFNVDKKTDEQLECIANATGGEYFSAKNAAALNEAIKVIAKKVEVDEVKPELKPVVKKLENNLEVSASETEGGKWVETSYDIYQDTEGEFKRIDGCHSSLKEPCKESLTSGKYMIKADYHHYEKKVSVDINESKVTKVHIIMGQTGKVEISASETEGGKWVSLYGYIYPADENGEKDGGNVGQVNNRNAKEPSVHKLPVGKYMMEVKYNNFSKKAVFEVKAEEVTKVHVIMGQTGKVEISASETEGGKWVSLYGYIYPADENGEKDGGNVGQVNNRNAKEPSVHKLPVGKYIVQAQYNKFEKEIPFEIKAGETTTVHMIFTPFHLTVKGINQCTLVTHEILSAQGQVIAQAEAPANKGADFILNDGVYTIESTVDNVTKKTKITIGGASSMEEAIVDFGGESSAGTVQGIWKTSEGKASLYLDTSKVQGSYDSDNGEIIGEMTYPQRFEGYWIEDASNTKCSESKNGRYYWGKVTWEFDSDMCSFKGKWSYCDEKPSSNWSGTFIQALPR